MTTIENLDDLRTTYTQVFDDFAVVPSDIVKKGVNVKYARQMLATLVELGVVVESEGEEGAVWQTFPDTYDDIDQTEALARFDKAVAEIKPVEEAKPAKAPKPKTMSDCLCGCGEKSQNHYRPGHDARHAGVVGREIAANYATKGFDRRTLLADLPSEALVAKAEAIAEKAIEKVEAKAKREADRATAKAEKEAAKAETAKPDFELGVVTVNKKERIGRRFNDGRVEWQDDKDQWREASKTASGTFVL